MKDTRKPITFRNDVYDSYLTFVNLARSVGHKAYIHEDLLELFNLGISMLNAKRERQRVGGDGETGSQKKIFSSIQEIECLSFIQKEYFYNGKIEPETFKLSNVKFKAIIQEHFKVRDKDAIQSRKIAIMETLKLKQVRIANSYYVVHKDFVVEEELEKLDDKTIIKNRNEELKQKLIDHIINKGVEGVEDIYIYKQLNNDKKLISSFELKLQVNHICKKETRFYSKEALKKINSKSAEQEAEEILGVYTNG